jgi:hypothetical protein
MPFAGFNSRLGFFDSEFDSFFFGPIQRTNHFIGRWIENLQVWQKNARG